MRKLWLLPVLVLFSAVLCPVRDSRADGSGQKQHIQGLTSERKQKQASDAETASSLSKTRTQETRRSPDGLWHEIPARGSEKSLAEAATIQKSYRRLRLNEATRNKLLRLAPAEFTKAARETPLIITLPLPDGTFMRFGVEESPIMEPALAARFPEIKTYRGKGLDDQTALARFDWTPTGLHAIVLSVRGTAFIEPETAADTSTYISYYQRNLPEGADSFECSTTENVLPPSLSQAKSAHGLRAPAQLVVSGETLRTYRLALAATAEFTQTYGGGTVGGALAALTTNINFVNAIYERDLAIRLILIANETDIIFTDAATDGYTSDVIDTMYNENQSVLNRVIGAGNYDIGHLFDGHSTFGPRRYYFQGRGELASVCVSGSKAKGVSIFRALEPSTTSAVYVVAHEMGHQFGAGHTFNGTSSDCGGSRMAATAYEPGSGSTIMGYRGTAATNASYFPICDEEDLHSTDTYFHAASLEQIINYTTSGNGSFCPVLTDTGNNAPAVSAGASYNIPRSTPFVMTATGSDPDGDALTYVWEEYDLGAAAPPNTDNGNRPIFRSFAPITNPSRTFPQLSDILSGTQTFGESLPTMTRTMRFRVTVRDNHSGGGGVKIGTTQVAVHSGSGPFIVTEPGFSASWQAGSTQTVTWDVANTSAVPVGCANVRISLSTDGGNTFPVILTDSTPNNGAATINVPSTPTSTARVKVEAIGNIFFNISPSNFTITAPVGVAPPQLLTEDNSNRAVALDSVTFVRDPFPLVTAYNFSTDQRTRILLFAVNLDPTTGEDSSAVTAQAEDAAHRVHPLQVEYVGKVPQFDWLTQVVVKLPDTIAGAGEVWVSISFRGATSDKALLSIK